MLADPVAPTIATMPNLTLERSKGVDLLEFVGTPVDPGFAASAKYFLEAAAAGIEFENVIQIYSGIEVESIKITVSDLNQLLLKSFPADQVSSIDFRIRTALVVDGGTGAESFEYFSGTSTADVTLYGLLRLDLIGSGMTQKIVSPLGNGEYSGLVKFDAASPFTLTDPETSVSYGGSGGALVVDGAAIAVVNEWHILTANIIDLTYSMELYQIGIIGDATGSWDNDQNMEYDPETGTWSITLDLVDGYIKFRKNDGWAWNMGLSDSGVDGELQQGGVGNDIPVTAGNYTVIYTILSNDAGLYQLIKN